MWDARQLPECLICPCFMFQLWSHSALGLVYLCAQTLFYPLSSSASQWHLLMVFQQLKFSVCGRWMWVFFLLPCGCQSAHTWFSRPNYTLEMVFGSCGGALKNPDIPGLKVITERGRSCLESVSSFVIHLKMANFSCLKSSPKTWFISVEDSQHWLSPARLLLQTLNGHF